MGPFKQLTNENFEEETKNGMVLVDFYADWCGPCRRLAPVLEKVAQKMQGKVAITKLNIEEQEATAAELQVHSFPTLLLFKDGEEIGRLIGLHDEDDVEDFILSSSENKLTF